MKKDISKKIKKDADKEPLKKETVSKENQNRPTSKNATIEDAPAPRAEQAP